MEWSGVLLVSPVHEFEEQLTLGADVLNRWHASAELALQDVVKGLCYILLSLQCVIVCVCVCVLCECVRVCRVCVCVCVCACVVCVCVHVCVACVGGYP